MKQDFNKAMDSLLRQHARRAAELSFQRDNASSQWNEKDNVESIDESHLDTDELVAFAENVVPDAARTRYAAHLADCDECRRFVIDLTRAQAISSDFVQFNAPRKVSARRSLREKLAALFAQRSFPYAVPAMAGLAVCILLALVAGIVLRRSQKSENLVALQRAEQTRKETIDNTVASNDSQTAVEIASVKSETQRPASSVTKNSVETKIGATVSNATRPSLNANTSTNAPRADAPEPSAPPQIAETSQAARSSSAGMQKSVDDDDVLRIEPRTTTDTNAPPTVQSDSANNPSASSANYATNEAAKAAANNSAVASPPAAKSAERRAQKNVRARTMSTTTSPTQNALPVNGRAVDSPKNQAAPATRRISGREFRRQGNVWMDTAYTSSQPTTNVARGSEQYRALVADEPAIAQIAVELSGEIILVWKKRSYRIY